AWARPKGGSSKRACCAARTPPAGRPIPCPTASPAGPGSIRARRAFRRSLFSTSPAGVETSAFGQPACPENGAPAGRGGDSRGGLHLLTWALDGEDRRRNDAGECP